MTDINVEELSQKITSGEKITIIDVRTQEEVARGRIKGSKNIPLDIFKDKIKDVVFDKNENVYLYCLSGSRSSVAAEIMQDMGYKNVLNVISGMLAWRAKGHPVYNAS